MTRIEDKREMWGRRLEEEKRTTREEEKMTRREESRSGGLTRNKRFS